MSGPPAMPPTLDEMMDFTKREGFYEYAEKAQTKRLGRVYQQLRDAQQALEVATARIAQLEDESGEWCYLAYKYGVRSEAERRKDTSTLNGRITIAADLIAHGGQQAIQRACMRLCKDLIREAGLSSPQRSEDA